MHVLALLLPALVVAAVVLRPGAPRAQALPAELSSGRVPLGDQPAAPDPLLYWSASEPAVGAALPGDARLLGAVRSGHWLKAPGVSEAPLLGSLFVYSLVDQEVVEIIEPSWPAEGER